MNILLILLLYNPSSFGQLSTSASHPFADEKEGQCATVRPEVYACEVRLTAMGCDQLKAPGKKVDCSKDSQVYQSFFDEAGDRVYGCAKGVYGVTIGAIIDLIKGTTAETVFRARYFDSNVYRSCVKREQQGDLEVVRRCKLRMLEEFPDLMVRYQANFDSTPYSEIVKVVRQHLREIAAQKPSLAKFLREHPDHPWEDLAMMARDELKKLNLKMECFTPEAQEELGCGIVASIIGGVSIVKFVSRRGIKLRPADAGHRPNSPLQIPEALGAELNRLLDFPGDKTQLFTNLNQSPVAGVKLSVSTGTPNLAKAAGGGRRVFCASLPKAFINELIFRGLARQTITTMNNVVGTEIEFTPAATTFFANRFKPCQ